MAAEVTATFFLLVDHVIGGGAQIVGAVNFKQAPHIEGKQRKNDGHHGQEKRLLELYAPANRSPGQLDRDQNCGNQPE